MIHTNGRSGGMDVVVGDGRDKMLKKVEGWPRWGFEEAGNPDSRSLGSRRS